MSSIEPTGELASSPSRHAAKKAAPDKSPARRALTFGVGALVILGGFGALIAWRKHHHLSGGGIGGAGALVFLLSLVSPAATLKVREGWMRFAGVLGWVNSRILLSVIFFLILTPLALLKKLATKEGAVDVRWRTGAKSDWRRPEPRDPHHYEHPW